MRALVAVVVVALAGCNHAPTGPEVAVRLDSDVVCAADGLVVQAQPISLPTVGAFSTPRTPESALVLQRLRALDGGAVLDAGRIVLEATSGGQFTGAALGDEETGLYGASVWVDGGFVASSAVTPLLVVPRPYVEAGASVVCARSFGTLLELRGSVYVSRDTFLGRPYASTASGNVSVTTSACVGVPLGRFARCQGLQVHLPPGAPGTVEQLVLFNGGCAAAPVPALYVGAPRIDAVRVPPCEGGEQRVEVSGDAFLVSPEGPPSVTLGGAPASATVSDCAPVDAAYPGWQRCRRLDFVVPATLAAGYQPLVVRNPGPVDCEREALFQGVNLPARTQAFSVAPASVCPGDARLQVAGVGFTGATRVQLGGRAAESVVVAPGGGSLQATFTDLEPGGPSPLVIDPGSAGTCSGSASLTVDVQPGPRVLAVVPALALRSAATRVTVLGVDLGTVASVELERQGQTTRTPVAFAPDPELPEARLSVVVPAGLSPGRYALVVRGSAGCEARRVDALTVLSPVSGASLRLSPPWGRPGAVTSLSIDLTSAGRFGEHPLVVFVDAASATPQAIEALAVTPASPSRLEVVVPALAAGRYDVSVLSAAGVVAGASFLVTALSPPVVLALEPPNVPAAVTQRVTVVGRDFRQPRVELRCAYVSGVPLPSNPLATVVSSDATHVMVSFDAAAAGASCVVRVVNADGTSAERLLAISDVSHPLRSGVLGPLLGQGRDAPVALAGDEPMTALHVVAGEAAGTPLDTVETSLVDRGVPGPFFAQRSRLVSARAGATGVQVGEVLYVVGGRGPDGGVLDTVERARPLEPPRTWGPTLSLAPAPAGLDAGVWSYRVAPVFSSPDAGSAAGEGVSWGPLLARVPALTARAVTATLTWAADPGVIAWRVYRSPGGAGAVVGTERLLAELPPAATAFVDTGLSVSSLETPLRPGALGPWEVLPARLATPRDGAAAAWAEDPADPTQGHLFVLGGRTADGQASAVVERLAIALASDGAQLPAPAFVSGAAPLAEPRFELAAAVATRAWSARVAAGRAFLYAVGGRVGSSVAAMTTEGAEVLPGGALGAWQALPSLARAGAGLVVGGGSLLVLGGDPLQPQGVSWAPLCAPGVAGCAASEPPALGAWAPGLSLREARVGLATARNGPFVFVVGGSTAAGLLRATEVRSW